jgi:demethylmenaquinone methyltransferase/2-methoxy-6-polyprenyl-1,4-benzoquinol methylase
MVPGFSLTHEPLSLILRRFKESSFFAAFVQTAHDFIKGESPDIMHGKAENSKGNSGPSRIDVWKMFDRMAPRYDLINHLISFGRDRSWRQKVASLLPPYSHQRVLDLATGTADQLLFIFEKSRRVRSAVGIDLSRKMIEIGRRKIEMRGISGNISLIVGSAMDIPADDNQFDAVTVSFGIRNVTDVSGALLEMYRVLKPAGRLLVLESSLPQNRLMRGLCLFYLRHIMPRVGGLLFRDLNAFRYLNDTIETFPSGEAFCDMLKSAGFTALAVHPITFGVVTIYQGDKPTN